MLQTIQAHKQTKLVATLQLALTQLWWTGMTQQMKQPETQSQWIVATSQQLLRVKRRMSGRMQGTLENAQIRS